MICKYCGSPMETGDIVCGNCGKKQEDMLQMERFDEKPYTDGKFGKENRPEDIRQSSDDRWLLPQKDWDRLLHSIREERKKNGIRRKKTALCLFVIVLINLILCAVCVLLGFQVGNLKKLIQEPTAATVQEEPKTEDDSGETTEDAGKEVDDSEETSEDAGSEPDNADTDNAEQI